MATRAITESEFMDVIGSGTVLIDFWASWCGPCRQFGPIFEKVSEEHPEVTFAKVDTDAEQNLSAQLQITSIPTLMAFRDGILVYRDAGALPAAQLNDLISKIQELDMDKIREDLDKREAEAQGK